MTGRENTKQVERKNKVFLMVLVFGLVLLCANQVMGKPGRGERDSSGKTLRSMARIYMAYGEYEKAAPLAEGALRLARRGGADEGELALCLIDLAVLYKEQGKLAEAEQYCELGLKLQEKIYSPRHRHIAYTLRTLSSIYQERGRYHRAGRALERALSIMLSQHEAQEKALIPFEADRAYLWFAQGDISRAQSGYDHVLSLVNECYGPGHLYTAQVMGEAAKFYVERGRYAEAAELINRAVATQERIYGSDHHLIAENWLTQASVCRGQGDAERAEKLIQKALRAASEKGDVPASARLARRAAEIRAGGRGPVEQFFGDLIQDFWPSGAGQAKDADAVTRVFCLVTISLMV